MKKLILIILLFNNYLFAQTSKVEEFCLSNAKSVALGKSMTYSSKENIYYKEESSQLTDMIIVGKNGKIKNYMKAYYFLNDEKKEKALKIFLDDSFEKDEDYVNEDSLDAERWLSKTKNIWISYVPFETYHIKITVFCVNNQ